MSAMFSVTGWLLRLARWVGPTEDRELIKRVRPATMELSGYAEDEFALTTLWAVAMVLAAILLFAIGWAPLGLKVDAAIMAFAITGGCIHCIRFVVARTASRLGEWRYRMRTGRESGLAAAMGEEVRERPHPILSLLLRSTDLDLLAQAAIAIAVFLRQ